MDHSLRQVIAAGAIGAVVVFCGGQQAWAERDYLNQSRIISEGASPARSAAAAAREAADLHKLNTQAAAINTPSVAVSSATIRPQSHIPPVASSGGIITTRPGTISMGEGTFFKGFTFGEFSGQSTMGSMSMTMNVTNQGKTIEVSKSYDGEILEAYTLDLNKQQITAQNNSGTMTAKLPDNLYDPADTQTFGQALTQMGNLIKWADRYWSNQGQLGNLHQIAAVMQGVEGRLASVLTPPIRAVVTPVIRTNPVPSVATGKAQLQ